MGRVDYGGLSSSGGSDRCMEGTFAFDRFESGHMHRIGSTLAAREPGNTRRCGSRQKAVELTSNPNLES